jgi:TolB-like protein
MKIYISLVFFIFCLTYANSQSTKVAILDFENTSGKTEYDALGKAMSSMLITDLSNNIHPKKVGIFERSQLNKLLEEQKLQKSKNFDAKTAVDFGKLSGVNYVFVGSVFVMDGNCNITSKLVDVQTSKIILSKEANGKIETWLQLKSQLAEAIAIQLNNPITLDPSYKDQSTTLSTINQYGKIVTTMDQGDVDKAEQMRSLFEETNPDFKYYADIKEDIDELKKQVAKNTADIKVLNKSGGRVVNANTPKEIINNIVSPLTTYGDASNLLIELLTYNIDEIKESKWGEFEGLWLPSLLPTDDLNIMKKDISFLENCLNNKNGNPISTSYYVFQHLRNYVGIIQIRKSDFVVLTEKIKELAMNLISYNLNHKIDKYCSNYFERSTYFDKESNVQIIRNPLDGDKYRILTENDFDIKWVVSFLN